MPVTTIYHNPRCSKSRQTLQLLKDNAIEPEVVLYLEQQLTPTQIRDVLTKLGMTARQLLRKGEAAYKENNLADETLSEEQIIQLMVQFPKLIERPIVIRGDKAMIGRPPESVLTLLK